MQLRLKGGGYASGTLLPSDKPGHVRLRCPTFDEPLEFDVRSVSSLETNPAQARNEITKQFFYLSNGTAVAGTWSELDETNVVINSSSLEKVRLPRAMLRHVIGNSRLGQLVYAGPRGADDWSGTSNATDWKYEAGALITSEAGTTAVGDVHLPDRSEMRITLVWSTHPNFTLSLGCSRPAKAIERIAAAASLEVWDGRLVLVREGEEQADMVALPDLLSDRQRLELVIYLDQPNGIVAVCTPSGRLLGKLEVQEKSPTLRRLIALSNHSDEAAKRELRLERCEVRQWNGELPKELPESNETLFLDDGKVLSGKLGRLQAGQTEISIISKDGKLSQVPLEKIQHAIISASNEADRASAESIEVELADGSHLVGVWRQTDSDKVVFALDGVDEPVRFLLSDVVGMMGNHEKFEPPEITGKIGQLQTEAALLTGCLVDSEGDGVLRWHALGALSPCRLAAASHGIIQYEAPRPAAQPRRPSQAQRGPLILLGQNVRAPNFDRLNPAGSSAPTRKPLEPGLKLRRGDELAGTVASIDERGVTFLSPETNVTFLPNDQMKSVVLATSRVADTQSPEKLKRLMTVPRASKNDPPTHLLISVNGDYLRGRLVKLDGKQTVLEVRMEEVELPTDRIAEIHWLHSRDWQEEKSDKSEQETPTPSDNAKLQVHLIRQNGRPITFTPSVFSDQTLQGKSDLLGDCKVELANVINVRFGVDLTESLQQASEGTWKLSLAISPKVYQESEGGPRESSSPLVGKPAPDFTLDTASGEKFELRSQRGRVLVLDFWASWCGPCLQTMPQIERIVNEVGGDQVDLIAVNLQETKERALATIKRLGLSPIVALDEDGAVAQQYQAAAIPQTVIIDRQGNVTHLFIGGGQRVLSEFAEALSGVVDAP